MEAEKTSIAVKVDAEDKEWISETFPVSNEATSFHLFIEDFVRL